jgi:hypothetical protein
LCRRGWPTYSSLVLLGLQHRRQQDSALGEQNHVVHNNGVWACAVGDADQRLAVVSGSCMSVWAGLV